MKKTLVTLAVMAITACMAFGQTNWGKAVMYDSRTGRFLDSVVISSNQLVVAGAQNSFTGTQTFYAITLGGVTQTNWPSGGGGVTFPDGSYMTNIWTGSTNTLYIVNPTKVYTNKIGQFGP